MLHIVFILFVFCSPPPFFFVALYLPVVRLFSTAWTLTFLWSDTVLTAQVGVLMNVSDLDTFTEGKLAKEHTGAFQLISCSDCFVCKNARRRQRVHPRHELREYERDASGEYTRNEQRLHPRYRAEGTRETDSDNTFET